MTAKWRAGLIAAALAALAFGVSQGLARSAEDGTVTSPIMKYDESCGLDIGKKLVGTATITKKGSTFKVSVQVHGADPGTNYLELYEWTGPGESDCAYIDTLKKFKVDASGHGAASGSVSAPGVHDVFASVYNQTTNTSNDALRVSL
jgi:hypothetical protein